MPGWKLDCEVIEQVKHGTLRWAGHAIMNGSDTKKRVCDNLIARNVSREATNKMDHWS